MKDLLLQSTASIRENRPLGVSLNEFGVDGKYLSLHSHSWVLYLLIFPFSAGLVHVLELLTRGADFFLTGRNCAR